MDQDPREIEAIKQLKARYCLLLDAKRWDDLRALFTDDATFGGDISGGSFDDPDAFIASVRGYLSENALLHVAYMPVIELTGLDRARGLWTFTQNQACGHYVEEYRRQAGAWLISSLRMTWIVPPDEAQRALEQARWPDAGPRWAAVAEGWQPRTVG